MFCTLKGFGELGIAKVVDDDPESFTIEFFDSPVGKERRRVSPSKVVLKRLGTNVRVYLFDSLASIWSVGRVMDDDGQGVEVRLQGGQDVYASYDDVYVRWKKPICDPVEFLAHGIT